MNDVVLGEGALKGDSDISMQRNGIIYYDVIVNKSSHLMIFKKCWNILIISSFRSKSNINKHDLTFATVSRIKTAFVQERLDTWDNFSMDSTIN